MSELLLILPDGTAAMIPNDYDHIREGIGNWIDHASGPGPVSAFVDDEGILDEREFNVVASIAVGRPIFGPAVLIAPEPDGDGNTLPPPPKAVNAFRELAAIWQVVLVEASRLGQRVVVHARPDTLPPPQIMTMTEAQMERWLTTGESPFDE